MGSIMIRNFDDASKSRLRLRAAKSGRSMEEEARSILRAALSESSTARGQLAQRIRQRFADFGDVRLPQVDREEVREPPQWTGKRR